jgi:putative transposase
LLELARYVVLNPVRAGICAMPQDWPWSSYAAMIEPEPSKPPPTWLITAWLLQQFGSSIPQARAAYIDHVRAGVGLPSIWESLQDQIILGDAKFAAIVSSHVTPSSAAHPEIPRLQRRAAAAPLAHFTTKPDRNEAITQAFQTGCYSLKDIGQAFGLHYATVSRIIKAQELVKRDEKQELPL